MKPFVAPVEDILFTLNHVAGAKELPDWDAGFASEIAGHFASFAEGEIAPLDESGDLEGCTLTEGRVTMHRQGPRRSVEVSVLATPSISTTPSQYYVRSAHACRQALTARLLGQNTPFCMLDTP